MKLTLCAVLAITLSACGGGHDQQYTWKDRMPNVDCTPRTPRAKAELKGCPKLADYLHPTLAEQGEIVRYLNRKNQIEGTIILGNYSPPGCLTWTVQPNNDVPKPNISTKPGCGYDLEQKLRDFNFPGPPRTTRRESEQR